MNEFGHREKKADRVRLTGGLILLAIFLILELTLGARLEDIRLEILTGDNDRNWAESRFETRTDSIPIPPLNGRKRIVYLSNSHAKTGGHVARHLQQLLDRLQPGQYEVLDLSAPGIFAPEMLQRFVSTLDYQPEALILAPAYISFSDRMKLSRQSITARGFFKPGIFSRLPAGFWLRNWDITLYGETLFGRLVRLFRYRNDLRDTWEKPLADLIKGADKNEWIRFLEVDENQKWKFPEGFDNNLFDWSLYSLGRKNHFKDFEAILRIAKEKNLPVLGVNLPIDFAKDPHRVDIEDYEKFRDHLAKLMESALTYQDYQDVFPVKFTSYDALHPTWHGARLHALDMVFRLNRNGLLKGNMSDREIHTAFESMEEAVSEEYRRMLNGDYPPLKSWSFRRYDPFEPANARDLLRRLATLNPSPRKATMVVNISQRIRYWGETEFRIAPDQGNHFSRYWPVAVENEIARAKERLNFFRDELVKFEEDRLARYPLPSLDGARLVEVEDISKPGLPEMKLKKYTLPEGRIASEVSVSKTGRTISWTVVNPSTRKGYTRTDILGDGSFLVLHSPYGWMWLPGWARGGAPSAEWGI